MNEIVNKFLLAGDKFMSEIHLRQPGFTYSACGPFTKNKGRIQKFKEIGDSRYICQNELDKACFQHDMAYGDFKDLQRRTASDKVYILIGIHSIQGWTANTRHGVTRKRNTKRLKHTGNLFRKNLQLKDVC